MKVLRLEGDHAAGAPALTLHPHLTVVRNLSGPTRRWLVETLGRLGVDATASTSGEIESSGVVLPFDRASMELLGLVEGPVAVITPQHLGVAGPFPGSTARSVAPGDPSGLAGRHGEPGDAHGPTTAGGATVAVEVLDDVQPPRRTGPSPIERRITALRQRRVELARLVEGIVVVDVTALREVLDTLEQAPATMPRPGADEMADAWRDLQTDLKGLEIGTSAEEREAMAEVARAQEAVAEAEAVLRQPLLTEEQVRRIEAAHAAYSEASDRVERRFGGGRARKQLAEAEAEELRLLRRFGFESWVDYMLNTAKRAADPDRSAERADLEAAREELEACIAELDAIPGAVGRRRRRARLQERQEELSDRVAEMLGHEPVGDQVEAELRDLVIPADRSREAAAVVVELERVSGVAPQDRTDVDEVVASARHVVARSTQAERRRHELSIAIEALDQALVVLDAAREQGATAVPAMDPLPEMAEPPVGFLDLLDDVDPGDDADVDAEVDADTGGSGRDDADEAAGPGPDQLELDIDDERRPSPRPVATAAGGADDGTSSTDRHLDPTAGAAEPAVSDGTDRFIVRDVEDRAGLVDDILWESLQLIAAARAGVPAGQLPVVFDDPFGLLDADECLEVVARLARYTDEVQMVVLTDRPEIARWATAIGPDHAAVVG